MITTNLILEYIKSFLENNLTTVLDRHFFLENIDKKDLELTEIEYARLQTKLTLAFITVLEKEAETVIREFYDKKLVLDEL